MNIGDVVYTPRFCTVKISDVFESKEEAGDAGYTEPTYYRGEYDIYGKSIDDRHMVFAAVRRRQ